MHKAALLRKATIVPADNRSSITPYSRIIKLLHDIQITVSWCMPTEPLLWARTAKLIGYDPKFDFPFLREFLVAGEALSEKKRKRIESTWGDIRVSQDYGSTETGSLAGECSHGNLHLWADRFIFELYDEEEDILKKAGEGQLVVSSLFREAMPLIRYNLGDYVRITYDSCECGWHLPIVEVIGRNAVPIVQQRKLFPYRLEDLIYDLPEENEVYFWRGKYSKEQLIIELETSSNVTDVEAKLKADIMKYLQIKAEVNVVPAGTLVPKHALLAQNQFTKPKFLFKDSEDWSKAILY
jgi:phenylacetate-CoA ligase